MIATLLQLIDMQTDRLAKELENSTYGCFVMKYIIQTLCMERLKQPGLLTYGIQKRNYNRPAFIAKFIKNVCPNVFFIPIRVPFCFIIPTIKDIENGL